MERALPSTVRSGVRLERRVRRTAEGLCFVQRFTGDGTPVLVTHRSCLLALVEVRRGALWLGDAQAPERFTLWVGPRSVVPMRFEGADVVSEGLGFSRAPSPRPTALLEWGPVLGLELLRGSPVAPLDADAGVPAKVSAARRRLHGSAGALAPVRTVAAEVGLDADVLARGFVKAYGVTPKAYCQRARLFDAALSLLSGASIVSAALDAGFNDLSRFYAQFRQRLSVTPGVYARVGNRQDRARGGLPDVEA